MGTNVTSDLYVIKRLTANRCISFLQIIITPDLHAKKLLGSSFRAEK
jgi:hypothetical protein